MPAVSPDGRTIAFVSTRDGESALYLMNADGSNVRRLSSGAAIGRPVFSRDGRILLTQRAGDTAVVLEYRLNAAEPAIVARIIALPGSVAPFPDGAHLLYGAGNWRQTQLETARLDGSDRRALTHDRVAYWCASVSPDGRRVAAGRRDSATMQIVVMNADGSNLRALTSFGPGESAECPRWAADGNRIAFQSGRRFPADSTRRIAHIRVVDVSSGVVTTIGEHTQPYQDETPEWFPDGKRIAFQSDRTGAWEIWVMNADGSNQKQLTRSSLP
jgi:TolB protein